MVMFRKAYNITSTTIYEILQNSVYYESGSFAVLQPTSETINGERPSGKQNSAKCSQILLTPQMNPIALLVLAKVFQLWMV